LKCTHQRHPSFTFKIEKKIIIAQLFIAQPLLQILLMLLLLKKKVSKKALCVKIILSSELFFSQP